MQSSDDNIKHFLASPRLHFTYVKSFFPSFSTRFTVHTRRKKFQCQRYFLCCQAKQTHKFCAVFGECVYGSRPRGKKRISRNYADGINPLIVALAFNFRYQKCLYTRHKCLGCSKKRGVEWHVLTLRIGNAETTEDLFMNN